MEGEGTRNFGVLGPGLTGVNLLVNEEDFPRAEDLMEGWDESKESSEKSADAGDWDAAPEQPGCDEPEEDQSGE